MTRKKIPRFAWAGIAIFIAGLLLVAAVGVLLYNTARERCEASVKFRDDSRAMWVWALERSEHPNDPKVIEFRNELNKRLYRLECDGTTLVPVGTDH